MVERWSAPKTSNEQKKVLSTAIQRDKSILSKQLTGQLELFMIQHAITLQVGQIASSDELSNKEQVMSVLEQIDWSFTQENTQYLSHDIHPYPAKFIPQIPAHLISRLSLPGERVLAKSMVLPPSTEANMR